MFHSTNTRSSFSENITTSPETTTNTNMTSNVATKYILDYSIQEIIDLSKFVLNNKMNHLTNNLIFFDKQTEKLVNLK